MGSFGFRKVRHDVMLSPSKQGARFDLGFKDSMLWAIRTGLIVEGDEDADHSLISSCTNR